MVLFLSLLALPLNAEFERFELNYNDEMIHGTLFSIQPRVDEFSTFIDGVYTRMIWADFGSGYQEVYNNQKDLTGLPEAAAEFYVASGEDDVFLVELRKTDLGNRGEGGILKLTPNGFVTYAPLATEALGQGRSGKFYYSFPVAADNGTLAMIGYDDRFPHFILLVTQDNVRIIAQESVTEFPGGGTFSRFSTVLNIAPDGSSVIFRGESTTGANGVFRWTEEGIEKIADSSTNIPGSDQSFNSFFDSSIESQLGVDGAVYLFNLQPSTLVSFQNGQLSTLLNVGDVVGGQPVEGISEFDLAPDGSVFVADFTRELRFQNGEWSVFQPFVGFETADGKSLNATHFVGDDGVYFYGNFFNSELLKSENSLYRKGYDGGELTKVLELDESTFGVPYTGGSISHMTENEIVFRTSSGIFIGPLDSIDGGTGNEGPLGLPETFQAAIANLPPALAGPLQDADFDGISNLAEYILGRNLASAELDGFASNIKVAVGDAIGLPGDGRPYLTFDVQLRASIGDAEVSFRYGADLSGLAESASAAIEIGASQANGEFETKQFRSPVPMDASASGFLGMVVRLND
ncbi:MAG: hypothetical protein ACFHW5_22765 [Verrucomicrobiota bacterium]